MRNTIIKIAPAFIACQFLFAFTTAHNASPRSVSRHEHEPKPEYHTLPPLREQAEIQNAWTEERRAGIPKILKKYGVDAWLVRLPFLYDIPSRMDLTCHGR